MGVGMRGVVARGARKIPGRRQIAIGKDLLAHTSGGRQVGGGVTRPDRGAERESRQRTSDAHDEKPISIRHSSCLQFKEPPAKMPRTVR